MSVSYCCCHPTLEFARDEERENGVEPHAPGDGGSAGSSAGQQPPEPVAGEYVKQFPFVLDPFQDLAIRCLHKGESVLVSAHTSAGKTVVAQYAIAMAMKTNQRVIYTTPIKALSNQKFRDLASTFADYGPACIGLMTGDVTANPEASCIVMTTEILRSMLYHGSDELREVSWVVFDEVHYLRDKERGVVWEESIVLLPPSIKLAFLSATIPNAKEFAQWISELKRLPCHVITTDLRPTPLQHYMFPAGGRGLYLIVDEKGNFLEDNFARMMKALDGDEEEAAVGDKRKKGSSSDIQKVVRCVVEQKLCPAIVFSFSRRECEALASQLVRSETLCLTTEAEKGSIREVYDSALSCLADEDQVLPQIQLFLPMLLAGVGVHHSGILPILRELVELLFQEGLIKVLFATETFALGLNMPAKTCVFSNCRKFDGREQRWISSEEYIQMAGRAGRRGIDERGVVITMFDQRLEPERAHSIIRGQAARLTSTFHLSYNLLLNAMRTTGVDVEMIISKSFHQFQNSIHVPSLRSRIHALQQELESIPQSAEPTLRDFLELETLREKVHSEVCAAARAPSVCLPFLCPGRLVRVCGSHSGIQQAVDYGWGAVVGFSARTRPPPGQSELPPRSSPERFIVDVVMMMRSEVAKTCTEVGEAARDASGKVAESSSAALWGPCLSGEEGGVPGVVPVSMSLLEEISSVRVYLPTDLGTRASVTGVVESVRDAVSAFGGKPPMLDVCDDMGVRDEAMKESVKRLEHLTRRVEASPWCAAFNECVTYERGGRESLREEAKAVRDWRRRDAIVREIEHLEGKVRVSKLHSFKEELKARLRVLRRMKYTNDDGVVTVKGRCACEVEISTDLVAVEMMLGGAFSTAAPEDIASVLSCCVAEEKDESAGHKQEFALSAMLKQMGEARRDMRVAEKESGLSDNDEDAAINTSLMDLVHMWCTGASFSELCEKTNLFEGSIIRAFRREAELLRQMVLGAASIGDTELEKKFEAALQKLQRGIPFSASLYL
mmetsp:Transcript_2965/g.7353  ORF Transcript_2965/g.7353 Transcript_2965/m.7353 type:complete len:1011 (+) Transcript_2965:72-3104(+)